jgi:hypothetical protein
MVQREKLIEQDEEQSHTDHPDDGLVAEDEPPALDLGDENMPGHSGPSIAEGDSVSRDEPRQPFLDAAVLQTQAGETSTIGRVIPSRSPPNEEASIIPETQLMPQGEAVKSNDTPHPSVSQEESTPNLVSEVSLSSGLPPSNHSAMSTSTALRTELIPTDGSHAPEQTAGQGSLNTLQSPSQPQVRKDNEERGPAGQPEVAVDRRRAEEESFGYQDAPLRDDIEDILGIGTTTEPWIFPPNMTLTAYEDPHTPAMQSIERSRHQLSSGARFPAWRPIPEHERYRRGSYSG